MVTHQYLVASTIKETAYLDWICNGEGNVLGAGRGE